ncbi:hypothetical protein SETIT_6G130500v2 [Setaria italica]|uniref:Secreted protein n=1 Tax=Setaria italica TaxID=4555 RepID=A0A368RLB6_SETIT|nr:hypothetical protein SETIT_6G130500v2 [Setaria italica]
MMSVLAWHVVMLHISNLLQDSFWHVYELLHFANLQDRLWHDCEFLHFLNLVQDTFRHVCELLHFRTFTRTAANCVPCKDGHFNFRIRALQFQLLSQLFFLVRLHFEFCCAEVTKKSHLGSVFPLQM